MLAFGQVLTVAVTDFFAQPKELKSIQEFLNVTRRTDARGKCEI